LTVGVILLGAALPSSAANLGIWQIAAFE
jgi:hypothetical protein